MFPFHETGMSAKNTNSSSVCKHIVGLTVLGCTRHQLSREQYDLGRMGHSLLGNRIPTYKTLKGMLTRMKQKLGLTLINWKRPLGNECYISWHHLGS